MNKFRMILIGIMNDQNTRVMCTVEIENMQYVE